MNTIFQGAEEIKKVLPQCAKFTLVGGCFDLIHVGHIHLLEYAASLEELLVVAVLSNAYIQTYKTQWRPIVHERQRARMVGIVRCVDFVYISNISPSSLETLRCLRPNSVVFEQGRDELRDKIQQRVENIKNFSSHTKVHFLPRYDEEEISTGSIIRKIRSLTPFE